MTFLIKVKLAYQMCQIQANMLPNHAYQQILQSIYGIYREAYSNLIDIQYVLQMK